MGKAWKIGGMGSIFPLKRRSDNLPMVIKSIDKKRAGEMVGSDKLAKEMIESEISVMMLNAGESLIRCYDSMDCLNKFWIVLERMNGDMEDIIKHCKETDHSYNENFCKYMLYRSL
jgi:serine/threonine protein kinase